jgi:hypothetical protein
MTEQRWRVQIICETPELSQFAESTFVIKDGVDMTLRELLRDLAETTRVAAAELIAVRIPVGKTLDNTSIGESWDDPISP